MKLPIYGKNKYLVLVLPIAPVILKLPNATWLGGEPGWWGESQGGGGGGKGYCHVLVS